MKIYTRKGDAGETRLLSGARVRKSAVVLHAIGTIDELNAILGLCGAFVMAQGMRDKLRRVQSELFVLGADLAATGDHAVSMSRQISTGRIAILEAELDAWDHELPPLSRFILPGGSPGSTYLHHARTVCRRAERWVVALTEERAIDPDILRYINRLSDWLFVAARVENQAAGVSDLLWTGGEDVDSDTS